MKKRQIIILCLINIFVLFFGACNSDYDIDQLYKIAENGNSTYDYVIKDKNNNVLIKGKDISKEPKVNILNEDLLSISVQTGTGISTKWTIYCNVNSGKVSDAYYSVLGEVDEKVVFVKYDNGNHCVVIRDVFNKEEYFKEVVLEDTSKTTDPVVDFVKIDANKFKIVFLKGEDHTETEKIIELN